MNIFILDYDIKKSAEYHCDKHVVKMIVETCQILSTVARLHGHTDDVLYKITHKNHPCVQWANKSLGNYKYCVELLHHLLSEYTKRYHKIHKCQQMYEYFKLLNIKFDETNMTTFVQCMPEKYQIQDTVEAYRNYYINEKIHIAKYKHSSVPYWLKITA